MTRQDPVSFFDQQHAENYDARNERMTAIVGNLHFLMDLVLGDLPDDARILSVGAGTGSEIIALAERRPGWTFIALEPSQAMHAKCREKIGTNGLAGRCECVNGYLSDLDEGEKFDAVLCLLVTQFILDTAERQEMFDAMAAHLRPGGYLINAEISADTASPKFDGMVEKWAAMQAQRNMTAEEVSKNISMMKQHVAVVPPADIEAMLARSGLSNPTQFFQSLLIHAWYGRK